MSGHSIQRTDGIYTVLYRDEHGEGHDLNATGEPCRDIFELCEFVTQLEDQGGLQQGQAEEMMKDICCKTCGVDAQRRTCVGCSTVAWVIDCGHGPQPAPIAADGTEWRCEDCAVATK